MTFSIGTFGSNFSVIKLFLINGMANSLRYLLILSYIPDFNSILLNIKLTITVYYMNIQAVLIATNITDN